jgi:AGCS family alanine or glycine:cation symporter
MRRQVGAILLAAIFLAAMAGDGWAQPEGAAPAAEAAAGEEVPAELTKDPAPAPAAEEPDWQARVDSFFGENIVTPIANVLMWDIAFWDDSITLPITVVWLIFGAVFFTLRMRFINFRAFGHAIQVTRGKYDDPRAAGEVSHFQALASALSATVGLGNIAGVAIAVATGGPGATFWMICAGLLGMSAKFAECTLGQKYRTTRSDGHIMGGAMYYLSKGLGEIGLVKFGKVLAVLFAILCIGGSLGGGNAFQVRQSLDAVAQAIPALQDSGWIYGAVMTLLVGVVIIGGIRRIAATAEKIVPVMCGLYVLACLSILVMNASMLPEALAAIVRGAFSPDAMYGGFLGVLVLGFRRAAFSNEAGVGSAAIAHSAARTDYPVREGIVSLLEPFIDTVVVCTMTALVIVITGAYQNPEYAQFVTGDNGAALTSSAMGEVVSWFPYLLSVAVILFAFSTMISWSYYGERCWTWLFGERTSLIYKLIFLAFVFLGSIWTATNVLVFGDLMILGMAFPNIIGVLLLSGRVKRDLDDYVGKLKAGKFPRRS